MDDPHFIEELKKKFSVFRQTDLTLDNLGF